MPLQEDGDGADVEAGANQRDDVGSILRPVGPKLKERQGLRTDDGDLANLRNAQGASELREYHRDRHEVDYADAHQVAQLVAEHQDGRDPLEGAVADREVDVLRRARMTAYSGDVDGEFRSMAMARRKGRWAAVG